MGGCKGLSAKGGIEYVTSITILEELEQQGKKFDNLKTNFGSLGSLGFKCLV